MLQANRAARLPRCSGAGGISRLKEKKEEKNPPKPPRKRKAPPELTPAAGRGSVRGAAGTSRALLPGTCRQVSRTAPRRTAPGRALTVLAAVSPVVGHGARPGCVRGGCRSAVAPARSQGLL